MAGDAGAQGGAWTPPANLSDTPISSGGARPAVDAQGKLQAVSKDWGDLSPHPPYARYAQQVLAQDGDLKAIGNQPAGAHAPLRISPSTA